MERRAEMQEELSWFGVVIVLLLIVGLMVCIGTPYLHHRPNQSPDDAGESQRRPYTPPVPIGGVPFLYIMPLTLHTLW